MTAEAARRTTAAPTASSRLGIGLLVGFGLVLGYVVLPWLALSLIGREGVQPSLDAGGLVLAGIALAVLGTARYVAKPTRAFGPVTMAYAIAAIGYLEWLIGQSPITLVFRGATVALGYSGLLFAAMVVPVLGLVSGAVTTLEDARRPGERLPFDFPG